MEHSPNISKIYIGLTLGVPYNMCNFSHREKIIQTEEWRIGITMHFSQCTKLGFSFYSVDKWNRYCSWCLFLFNFILTFSYRHRLSFRGYVVLERFIKQNLQSTSDIIMIHFNLGLRLHSPVTLKIAMWSLYSVHQISFLGIIKASTKDRY